MSSYSRFKKYRRKLTPQKRQAVVDEVKMMLHAHRDCLRNKGVDTSKVQFDCRDGYYGEAFGVMRGLAVLGYGGFGPDNIPHDTHPEWNLKWWFSELCSEVLAEENYGGDNHCDFCITRYGKDGAGRNRSSLEKQSV